MIKIISDTTQFISEKKINTASNIKDYAELYDVILNSILSGKDCTFPVNHSIVIKWIQNMASRYPQGTFVFKTIDARGALAQLWDINIPVTVTNEDILQAGLLMADLHPQPGFTFEDTLLSHYYSPIFTSKSFPFNKLAVLLEAINPDQWKANSSVPLLTRTLHSRMEEWKSKSRSSEQRQLVDLFDENPSELKQQLVRFNVLRSYPSIGEALLGDIYPLFRMLKLQLQDLIVEESKIPETVLQVTYHLNSHHPQCAEELGTIIERMSGLLTIEFDTIEKHLLLHPDWITQTLIEQIENKFSSHSRRFARRIKALQSFIRPVKPDYPELSWDVDAMLSWATDSYLPYQAWCNSQEQFDPELFVIGDRFSEWLIKGWNNIHANSKRMVFNILPNKAVDLKQTGVVNLVLVVDNLGWAFSRILAELFQEQGYFLVGAEPYLAMLPSETEISKKCLLAGAVGYQAIDNKNYTGMIEKGWIPFFKDTAFRYISNIGSLRAIKSIDATTYVVNYLAVDRVLHKSADEIGMLHQDHIYHLLEKLVENTVDFIEKHGLQESIRIHVVSDHGSTRIPSEIPNDIDIDFFKTNGFEARSHRFVKVSNQRFTEIADNLKMDCFFLPANDFLNPENFLCARRGNRFLPTDKNSYVHGGLMPEEVIVPYMVFEPANIPVLDLTVLLKNNIFRYRMETIALEIGNPNDTAVEQIQVSMLNGNIECEPQRIILLNGKTNTVLQFNARFKLTSLPEEKTYLHIRLRFNARGEQHSFNVRSPITMKKMIEEKSSGIFDD